MSFALIRVVLVALILCISRLAVADDAGEGGTMDDSGSDASGNEPPIVGDGMGDRPIACDGALCDTTNGAGCGLVDRPLMGPPIAPNAMIAMTPLVLVIARRIRGGALRPRAGTIAR